MTNSYDLEIVYDLAHFDGFSRTSRLQNYFSRSILPPPPIFFSFSVLFFTPALCVDVNDRLGYCFKWHVAGSRFDAERVLQPPGISFLALVAEFFSRWSLEDGDKMAHVKLKRVIP